MSRATADLEYLAAALPERHTWIGPPTPASLAPLPNSPGVLLFVDEDARPVQLLTTQQLRRVALARLLEPPSANRRHADLAAIVRAVWWRSVCGSFDARWWYYRLARQLHPRDYRRRVAFGPAWFLNVDWDTPVPELTVTEHVYDGRGQWLGPWPTRAAAQATLEGLWDLFDLCRHPEQVRKSPLGTRCVYAEMGRCDAPCDGSVPLGAYVSRTHAAWTFAAGGVTAWRAEAEERMRAAAAAQRFEAAGLIKRQLEFARRWQSDWQPVVRTADGLQCVLFVQATRRKTWQGFVFNAGTISPGPLFRLRDLVAGAEAWLQAALAAPAEDTPPAVRMEQTWLIARSWAQPSPPREVVIRLESGAVPVNFVAQLQMGIDTRPAAGDPAFESPASESEEKGR